MILETERLLLKDYQLENLEALALQHNKASCRVLEECGFILEGILRNFNKSEMGYRNVCYYGMISSDLINI
jgi:[ribosomal protein S5]-alanine N-acetyltransferase